MKKTIKLLYEIRQNRGAKFMFMPKTLSFFEICKCIYFEYVNIWKSDEIIIVKFLKELFRKGLILEKSLSYSTYNLDNFTYNDVNITTSDNKTFSRGTSIDKSEAYAKAVGEVLERTSVRYNKDKVLIESQKSMSEKKLDFISISDFSQPTQKQLEKYLHFNIDNSDIFSWTKVLNIKDNKDYYAPSQTVFYGNAISYPNEKHIIHPTTHGAGAGYTEYDADRSCICEVIHRHFYLKNWYAGKSVNIIDIDSIPKDKKIYSLIQDLKNRDFKVNLLDYSDQAGLPTVMCVIEKEGGWSCGGTTGVNIDSVIQRAISESMAAYLWYAKNIAEEGCKISHVDISKVEDGFVDDVYGETNNKIAIYNQKYFIDKNKNSLDFLLSGKVIPYDNKYNKNFNYDIKKHAIDIFGDVYFYKVENNYLPDFNYFVKKVIVPNSYSFPMEEKYSRPTLNGDYPQVTILNPFV